MNKLYHIPWGIYYSDTSGEGKYYIGISNDLTTENGEDAGAVMTFFNVIDMLEYDGSSGEEHIVETDHIVFNENVYGYSVSSDKATYNLVEEFPFGMGTPDSSKLSKTIKNVEKEIRNSMTKK